MKERSADEAHQRVLVAQAIEQQLERLAEEYGHTLMLVSWAPQLRDLGADDYRLDVWIDDYSLSLYFTKEEMASSVSGEEKGRVSERLRELISSLHNDGFSANPYSYNEITSPLRLH